MQYNDACIDWTLSFRSHDIAVIGPHGNATNSLIQVDTGRLCPSKDEANDEVDFDCVEQPVQAIARYNTGAKTTFAQGVSIVDPFDESGIPAAVRAAEAADVVVLALGIAECGSYMNDASYPLHSCDANHKYAKYAEAEAHDRCVRFSGFICVTIADASLFNGKLSSGSCSRMAPTWCVCLWCSGRSWTCPLHKRRSQRKSWRWASQQWCYFSMVEWSSSRMCC